MKDRAGNGGSEGDVRVRDAELVKVVQMGYAEDQGGEKYGALESRSSQQEERDGSRTK